MQNSLPFEVANFIIMLGNQFYHPKLGNKVKITSSHITLEHHFRRCDVPSASPLWEHITFFFFLVKPLIKSSDLCLWALYKMLIFKCWPYGNEGMTNSSFPLMFTSGLTLIEWKVGHCRMFPFISPLSLSPPTHQHI